MKLFNKFKTLLLSLIAITMFFVVGNEVVYATESNIESGIYEIQNDVYHESEVGMSMSRSYLMPSMTVEVRKDNIVYTIGFSGSEYMENYRMKLNEEEVPVEIVEENNEDGIVKLKIIVDKVDADMDAMIYVGPMERDVQFKVIPKMDTLTLIEAIEEEVLTVAEEDNNTTINEENEEKESQITESTDVVEENNEENKFNVPVVAISIIVIVVIIGVIITIKSKKK